MDTILETQNVSKTYGKKIALENVSIKVEKGDVFGLLGPNGAGKTTLIRMINQIFRPDSGNILFETEPLNENHISSIGYLPEERGLYKKMKVGKEILYLAELKGLTGTEAREQLDYWAKKFEISSWLNKKVQELSKGMQQKVQFIATVMHRPKLLIFDEPFSGFDPLNADLLKNEILKMKNNGSTIIFSTHNMESVEQICNKIVLINSAHNILEGKVSEIKQRFKKNIFRIVVPKQDYSSLIIDGTQLISVEDRDNETILNLQIEKGKNASLLSHILEITDIISYSEVLPSMHEIFVETVKSNGAANLSA